MQERNRGDYQIASRETIAEGQDLRVRALALQPGQSVPWHYHSHITDSFVGLDGITVVETRDPEGRVELAPGNQTAVAPGRAHKVTCGSDAGCRFLVIQGVGVYDFVALDEN